MKRLIAAALLLCLLPAACSAPKEPEKEPEKEQTQQTPQPEQSRQPEQTEEKEMTITVTVGSFQTEAALLDNPSARELMNRLPLTLSMEELHGNEKYYYFDKALPAEAGAVGSVSPGDLMLYGDDCLVIFYKGFSTPYHYTPLGKLKNTEGLAEALGSGEVTITFE